MSAHKNKCEEVPVCREGILLPVWEPNQPGLGDQVARAVVYFVSLMYMFLGVSIIADRFMASIEVITSQVGMRVIRNFSYYIILKPGFNTRRCRIGHKHMQIGLRSARVYKFN